MSDVMPRGGSRIRSLTRRLMGASSYLCLALLLNRPAPAAAQSADPPPAIINRNAANFHDHWFFSLEGGYAINGGPSNLAFAPADPKFSNLSPLRPGTDGGFAGATIGHTMGPEWDAALSYHATLFGKANENVVAPGAVGLPVLTSTIAATASSSLWYQTFDAEVGYHPPAWLAENVRIFFGPRILTGHSGINYDFNNPGTDTGPGTFDKLGNFSHDIDLAGIGPRAGFEASVPLAFTTAPVTFDLSGAGSVIFTTVKDDYAFFSSAPAGFPAVTGGTDSVHYPIVYGLEGKAGLTYHMNSATALEVGYQMQQWYNLATSVTMADDLGGYVAGRSNVLVHGPFGKITVELP